MNRIKFWIHNSRTTSLPQSLMPAILAVVLAIGNDFCWWTAALAVIGVVLAHFGMNLADDYFDYKVDMKGDRDRVIRKGFRAMTLKYPYLSDGSATLKDTARAIMCMGGLAVCCGLCIFLRHSLNKPVFSPDGSWWIIAICIFTIINGLSYSAPPLKLGYRGLGEFVIGTIFGPMLMMGVYYSACGSMDWNIVFISIPVGLLVMNILFVHSIIDMPADAESNKMTFARVFKSDKGRLIAEAIIIFLPFAMIIWGVAASFLHPFYLLCLLVLPRAIWLFNSIVRFMRNEEINLEKPSRMLGPVGNWDKVRELGLDWFLIRWFTARNTLSGFCICIVIAKIAELIF